MSRKKGKSHAVPAQASEASGEAAAAVVLKPPPDSGYRSVPIEHIVGVGKKQRQGGLQVKALAASIARDGLLQPLIVQPEGDRYWLMAGRRRLEAVKSLGWKKVAVHVITCESTERVEALAAVENLERQDLTPVEEALAVARLLKTLGGKQDDLERGAAPTSAIERAAALLGRSPAWVRDRGMLLRLCPEVLELVASKQLPLGQAREIAKLASAADQQDISDTACGAWPGHEKDGSVSVQSVSVVRLHVEACLSTLRGVPWKPDVAFAGQPACAGCSNNSANTLLFGVDSGDKAPEARCLDTKCYLAKMRAAEKSLRETVEKVKKDKAVTPTEAGVRGVAPKFLKTSKVARELERVRGGGTKKGKAGGATEKKEIPWNDQPEQKFSKAHRTWEINIEEAVGKILCTTPTRVACFLVGCRSPAFTQHIGYSPTPPKSVRDRIEPILKRIASGTLEDLKALAEGYKPEDILSYRHNSPAPFWTLRHLAGLLKVNLPAEPKLEEFMPKPEAEKLTKAGVCHVCGCTEDKPCPGGCAWADKTKTLCTKCANGEATKAKAKKKK